MKTRRAAEGSQFHQERYASSVALEKGLNGVLVKNRCATLTEPSDIELVWFLQYQSMRQGGLEKFAADLLTEYPERLGTPAMLKIGAKPDCTYNAVQVRAVRDETCSPFCSKEFILAGETTHDSNVIDYFKSEEAALSLLEYDSEEHDGRLKKIRSDKAIHLEALRDAAKLHPRSYPVSRFLEICRELFREKVPEILTRFCLDPAFTASALQASDDSRYISLPFFHDLYGALMDYLNRWEERQLSKIAATKVGEMVLDAMEYSEAERALVLIEGVYGTGKTWPAKIWCEARPGKRRFVQCPSSNDNLDFFRTMAEPFGISNAHSMKGQQMRARINDVLQAGHLTVVIDESHYLFPQASTRVALPGRINWVMTALTNHDVPVVMVATPQFMTSRAVVERNTFWAAGQLDGRISRYVPLPEELGKEDLTLIARAHLPSGDEKSIKALVLYAITSKKRLRAIEHGVKAARHMARRAGKDDVTFADIKRAMEENVMPSDSALNAALSKVTVSKNHPRKAFAPQLQQQLKPIPTPLPKRENRMDLSVPDRRSVRSSVSLSPVEM